MPRRTVILKDFVIDTKISQKKKAVKIVSYLGVGLSHKNEAVEYEIKKACRLLTLTAGLETSQYDYIQKLLAFLEIAEFSVHRKRKTTLYEDLMSGEIIYPDMYEIIQCDII